MFVLKGDGISKYVYAEFTNAKQQFVCARGGIVACEECELSVRSKHCCH